MHYIKKQSKFGFTLVELMVAVVIMAILASIIVISYNGVHERARDTKRLNDITAIKEALETFRASTGAYPIVPSGPYGGWNSSADGGGFLVSLQQSGFMNIIPIDPINSAPTGINYTTGMRYQYFNFTDQSYLASKGCATNRGNMAVLMIVNMDSGAKPAPGSPGFSCTGRNFNDEGAWVWGDYDKPA